MRGPAISIAVVRFEAVVRGTYATELVESPMPPVAISVLGSRKRMFRGHWLPSFRRVGILGSAPWASSFSQARPPLHARRPRAFDIDMSPTRRLRDPTYLRKLRSLMGFPQWRISAWEALTSGSTSCYSMGLYVPALSRALVIPNAASPRIISRIIDRSQPLEEEREPQGGGNLKPARSLRPVGEREAAPTLSKPLERDAASARFLKSNALVQD